MIWGVGDEKDQRIGSSRASNARDTARDNREKENSHNQSDRAIENTHGGEMTKFNPPRHDVYSMPTFHSFYSSALR